MIVASPAATAVTVPSDTFATEELLEVQITLGSVALSGSTVAVKVAVSSSTSSRLVLSSFTDLTLMKSGVT